MSKVKWFSVSIARVFSSVIFLLVLIVGWRFYLSEPTKSVWFHITHGSKVEFQGHKMTLPLMWRVNRFDKRPGLALLRASFLHPPSPGEMWDPELVIYSPTLGGAGVLDEASAASWQAEMIARISTRNKKVPISAEIIHSKLLNYYSVDSGDIGEQPNFLKCKAGGTDWLVVIGENKNGTVGVQEARDILKSME